MTVTFVPASTFEARGSCFLEGRPYSVDDTLDDEVRRWRDAGLVAIAGEDTPERGPRCLTLTVSRPTAISSTGNPNTGKRTTVLPRVLVEPEYASVSADTIRVTVAPDNWSADELRACFEAALATLEAAR